MNVADRQTTDGRATAYSKREFTFDKNRKPAKITHRPVVRCPCIDVDTQSRNTWAAIAPCLELEERHRSARVG